MSGCIIFIYKSTWIDLSAEPSQPVTKLRAEGIGSVCGRLYFGTAEKISPSELIDTTGAGDAFTGAVLYGTCTC